MNKIVTFYAKELPNADMVTSYQKKVFKYFGLDIEQIEFTDTLPHPHSEAMTNYFKENKDWDTVTIFDVDCVPTSPNTIKNAINIVRDGNTIYGNAQATHNKTPFAAPNFFTISKIVWKKTIEIWERNEVLHKDIFRYQEINDVTYDVGEIFNIEHRKIGTNIVLSYPIKNEGKPEWVFNGNDSFPRFEWGNGTWFDSNTFHGSEIRYSHKQQIFFDVCRKIIS